MPNPAPAPEPEADHRGQPRPREERAAPPYHGSLDDALGRPGALASPAARLQATLGAEFAHAPAEDRWPLRWPVAMVFTTCGAFWPTVYFVVAALIG